MIPKNAKKVFQGVLFSVWQWEQELFDGTTTLFEKLQRPDTVNVLPVVDNKILLLQQIQPGGVEHIALPGGRVDAGETLLQTAERELLEETGYQSKLLTLWNVFVPEEKIEWQIHTFIARDATVTDKLHRDGGEAIQLRFFNFDEFLLLSENPKFRHPNIASLLLKARLDVKRRDELYKLLFSK